MSSPPKPQYVQLLDRWRNDGTFTRLNTAIKEREPVHIVRSSGERQRCIITSMGHAGLGCLVEWTASDGEKRYKYVKTEDMLKWNPRLTPVAWLASS